MQRNKINFYCILKILYRQSTYFKSDFEVLFSCSINVSSENFLVSRLFIPSTKIIIIPLNPYIHHVLEYK